MGKDRGTAAPGGPCGGQGPVTGAWVYDPAGRGDAVFLYLFRDSGRYDAVALPRAETAPLGYELWATGGWVAAGGDSYDLSGRIIRHYLATGDLQAGEHNETLTYDPAGDILFNRNHPAGVFTRLSCIPEVPEGIEASIPFDLVAFNTSPSLSFEAGE